VWVRAEDGEAVIGLSDYLQDQMGDITGLELPEVGDVIRATRPIGKVESEDASSPIESPVSGEVIDVNSEALDNPEVVNGDPYTSGWLIRVRMEHPGELDDLIGAEEYADLTMEV
jgi:glycine cleavage system H protein